jgi:hypothetical protein
MMRKPEVQIGNSGSSLRRSWANLLAISALVLVPCFWHKHIEAGDLASHVYNAWLVQLIHHGEAPGLWTVRQNTNVLFDLALSAFGSIFGLGLAEKIVVSVAVLIFFWGACALVYAVSRRFPWSVLPVIAMVTYGWTFGAGFFNYYLAIGLSFWALAFFWQHKGLRRLVLPVLLAPLIELAYPLGLIWLCGAAAYIAIAEFVPRRFHPLLLLGPAAIVLSVRFYIRHHFPFYDPRVTLLSGVDQFIVFGWRYEAVVATILFLGFVCLLNEHDVWWRRREPGYWNWKQLSVPLQLYVIVEMAVVLVPAAIFFPQYSAPFMFLGQRLTSISAVLWCTVLGVLHPRKWHAIGFATAAAVFFTFLYQDTATLSRMEDHTHQMVSALPPGSRVLSTILWPAHAPTSIFITHIVDRACIDQCFSYGNYEPASRQFRVRASPENGIVMASDLDVSAAGSGV